MCTPILVCIMCVLNIPFTNQHFFKDGGTDSSELFETEVPAEKLRPPVTSRFETEFQSKNSDQDFKLVNRRRRSAEPAFSTPNHDAAIFFPRQHTGSAFVNIPSKLSRSQNKITPTTFLREEMFPSQSEPYSVSKSKVATERKQNVHQLLPSLVSSPDPKQSSAVLKTSVNKPEPGYGYSLNGNNRMPMMPYQPIQEEVPSRDSHTVLESASHQLSEPRLNFDRNNALSFNLRSNHLPNNITNFTPNNVHENIPTEKLINRLVSGQEFLEPSQDFSYFEPQANVKNNKNLKSDSTLFSKSDQYIALQPYEEYSAIKKPTIDSDYIFKDYPEITLPSLKHDAVLPDAQTSHSKADQILRSIGGPVSDDVDDLQIQLQGFLPKQKREDGLFTDPAFQNDLGIVGSLLKSGEVEVKSSLHDAAQPVAPSFTSHVAVDPRLHVERKPVDEEPSKKLYQPYYNPQFVERKPVDEEPSNKLYQPYYNPQFVERKPVDEEPSNKLYQSYYNPQFVERKPVDEEPSNKLYQPYYNPQFVERKPVDEEPSNKLYQPYYPYLNPTQNVNWPYGAPSYNPSYLQSGHGVPYNTNPEKKITVYKEGVALPSHVANSYLQVSKDFKDLCGEECKATQKESHSAIKSEPEEEHIEKKAGKNHNNAKKQRKYRWRNKLVGKKIKGKEAQEEHEESLKKKWKKNGGFLRWLDVVGRRPDNIADRVLNRSWDRLYRNHKNCWHYNSR